MIKYKGIIHNILNDAPFIGALIIAPSCMKGCSDCLNEHLKNNGIFYKNSASEIISKVLENGLNKGIILSGLEWTESPESLKKLVNEAINNDLEVIIYTHKDEKQFFKEFKSFNNKPIYVKFGQYHKNKKTHDNIHFGVKLATSNQYIKYFGVS
ncbi:MAG: 4Fe-4S cluster-binding domain-containing protein [Bacillota bacterium]